MYKKLIKEYQVNINSLNMYLENAEEAFKIKKEFLKESSDLIMLLDYINIKKEELNEENTEKEEKKRKISEVVEKQIIENMRMTDDGGVEFKLKNYEVKNRILETANKMDKKIKQDRILYSGTLMLLVVYFEEMISKMLLTDLLKYPRIKIEENSITFEELKDLGSIDEAKKYLIEKEVNIIMKENCDYWFNEHIKKLLKLKLNNYHKNKAKFNEIMARRNLLVHNEGCVNKYYLNRVGKDNIYSVKVGDKLKVDNVYIKEALETFEEVGIGVLVELYLKEPISDNDIIDLFEYTTDNYLFKDKYKIALVIYELLLDSKKIKGELKKYCELNYWQCHKWLGTTNDKVKELEKEDYSIYDVSLKLGGFALQERYDEFYETFNKQTCITLEDLKEWPVFKLMRKDDRFIKMIEVEEKNKMLAEVSVDEENKKINFN
ncbi:hypothetical protein M3X99_04115 [Clostridium perfringens]|uniref:Uncharacterized protein n=2 Tax=Clostridium perfringens TaxID=1502 RepID=A0A8H9UWG3_CLOPF|nr:hypothetical protein [Clostridium perfringens]EDT16303.1 hypothetical protein AC3_2486 [Clostridium perfringens E str. JGS1987]EJT6558573.1 hypothetical protein [Clostridium perfringens]ELC8458178.1 hypothetical protein [Clostridium perfringens]MCX0376603.1 hypothetical protein [Clostridium perfringens]MDC4250201.1 hypothetical protein [Clostridium perfringens]